MDILQISEYYHYQQNETVNSTISLFTTDSNVALSHKPPFNTLITTILATLAGITSFCTIIGNIMVVISFAMEKSIRHPANYLIASLAVTDIIIGSCSMPFYTMYLLLNYWPLGAQVCNLWLSIDYTVCLVSQYTVFLITLDRFCSVKMPAKYRTWRTETKMKVMIFTTWVIPTLIFFTTIIGWPYFVKNKVSSNQDQCVAEFQNNKIFSAVLVICYYWVTLLVMIGLYAGIYQVALKLHKRSKETRKRLKFISSTMKKDIKDANEKENLIPSQREATPAPGLHLAVSYNTASTTNTSNSPSSQMKHESTNSLAKQNFEESPNLAPDSLEVNGQEDVFLDTENMPEICSKEETHKDDSPVWKPRDSLPDSSIHWDAITGNTFHKIEKPVLQAAEQPPKEPNVKSSLNLKKKQSPSQRNRSDGKSLSDYNDDDSSSETQDSDNKAKTVGNFPSVVAFLAAPKVFLGRQKKPSIRRKRKENHARKALRTITFILGAFVICWTPYHVIILIDSFCTTCEFSGALSFLYQFSYWLCYINSPINPFCYALSNPQFKKSFIKILKFQYLRQCWQKFCRHERY